MDDQDKALNEDAETETAEASTPEEEQTTEGEQEETPQESKKGYSARVQELANKARAAEDRANSLEEKLHSLTDQVGQQPVNPVFSQSQPLMKPDEELTVDELNRRVEERENRLKQQMELRYQQERAINRINREASEVVRLYPQLDPDSEHFDKDLSDDVTSAAEDYIKANPAGSLKGFVSKIMKPISKQVTKEVEATTENIPKHASQGALRPSNVKPTEKKFEEKSIEEMEAELGFARG